LELVYESVDPGQPTPDTVIVEPTGPRRPVALITGASGGLGLRLARTFLHGNWRVIPLFRQPPPNDPYASWPRIEAPLICDLAQEGWGPLVESYLGKFSAPLNLLVNNAGIGSDQAELEYVDHRELSRVLAINCIAALEMARVCWPSLRRTRQPAIINISSRLGSLAETAAGLGRGTPSYAYRISKAALNMATLCLHRELAPKGAVVIAVHPGKLNTPLSPDTRRGDPADSARRIFDFVSDLSPSQSGKFFDMYDGEIPW